MESIVPKSDFRFGYAFRNWNYAMVLAALKLNFQSHDKTLSKQYTDTPSIDTNWINAQEIASSGCNSCIDTRCGAMLIDWNWLKAQLLKIKIFKMATLLKVRGIGTSKHKTDKYVLELLYFPAIGNKGQRMIVCIYCELHIVDNLRANIFIGNNIIGTKGMMINIAKEKAYILGCKVIVPITAKHRG